MPVDLEKVRHWILEHPETIHSAAELAGKWGVSSETLRKDFWRREGVTLKKFILKSRIEFAKRLLIETNLLCKEVCLKSGFAREDSGCAIFKREVGLTMIAFRNSNVEIRPK